MGWPGPCAAQRAAGAEGAASTAAGRGTATPWGGGVAWVVISHLSNPSAFIPLSSLCTLPLETTVEFAEAGVGADLSPDGFSRWCSGGGQGDRVVTLLGIIGTITHCNLTQH